MVCVKAVPDENEEIHLDKNGQPMIPGGEMVGSAFDRCALELAVRRKEETGGRVTVVSIGEEACKAVLKNCLAVGADRGVWIREQGKNVDTVLRAKITAEFVHQMEEEQGHAFDVILCGVESTDLGNGMFGPALAEFLRRPYAAGIRKIEETEAVLLAEKETETGYEILNMMLPAVIMVTKTEFNPRYPTLKSKMAARKIEIAEKEVDAVLNRAAESSGKISGIDYSEIKKEKAGIIITEETEKAAKEAVELMKSRM